MGNDPDGTQQDDGQAGDGQGDGTQDEGARLDRLEATVNRIAAVVDKLTPGTHAEAQQRTENRLDRPTDIQSQVRAELDRRDREAADRQAADTAAQEQRELRDTVARLQEQPPAPPVPRRTRLLGWGE